MEKLLELLGPQLPPLVYWPLLALIVVIAVWPKVQVILSDLLPWNRAYLRAKRNLELLKLRYEVRAIKKGLGEAIDSEDLNANPAQLEPKVTGTTIPSSPWLWKSIARRFAYGALGALTPYAFANLFFSIQESHGLHVPLGPAVVLAAAVGVGCAIAIRDAAQERFTYVLGLAVVLFVLWYGSIQSLTSMIEEQKVLLEVLRKETGIEKKQVEKIEELKPGSDPTNRP